MNRLTHERVNGIKTGYWSDCKKEDLIKALAAYENTGIMPDEISEMKKQLIKSWIPFTVDEEGILNCEIPEEDVEILISDKNSVWVDTFLFDLYDNEYYLDSGHELCGLAWQPLPEPYNQMKR